MYKTRVKAIGEVLFKRMYLNNRLEVHNPIEFYTQCL